VVLVSVVEGRHVYVSSSCCSSYCLSPAPTCSQITTGPYQLALAGGGGALQASALQNMLADIQQAAESHTQAQMR